MTNYFRRTVKPRRPTSVVCDVGQAKYRSVTRFQFNYLVWVQLFAMLTAGLQAEIMGDAAPTIARKFHAELKLSWMASSGFLVQVCTLLVFGKMYDFLEPKKIMLCCSICFLSGSVVSARSSSFLILIAGQALAGLGRSGITVGAVLILAVICPDRKKRALYLSIVTASYGVMLKIAPVISGLLLEDHSKERWRWIFWICVPFQATLILLVCAFPNIRRRTESWQQCKEFDYFGGILQGVAMASFVLPLLIGNNTGRYAWNSPLLIGLYILSPLLLVFFIYWESHKAEEQRFVPLKAIYDNRSIVALALIAASSASIIAATTFFLPQYLQLVRGSSPVLSALQLLPGILLGSASSIAVGKILSVKGSSCAQFICIAGSLCQILGGLAFYLIPLQENMAVFYMISLVTGFGAGSLFAIGLTLVLEILPDSSFGQITAFMNTATAIGSVLGVSLQGVVVQTIMERLLASIGGIESLRFLDQLMQDDNDSVLTDFLGLSSGVSASSQLNVFFADFRHDYHNTQRQASLLYTCFGFMSLVASLCLKPLSKAKSSGVVTENDGYDEEEYNSARAVSPVSVVRRKPVVIKTSSPPTTSSDAAVIVVVEEKAVTEKVVVRTLVEVEKSSPSEGDVSVLSGKIEPSESSALSFVTAKSTIIVATSPDQASLDIEEANIKRDMEIAIAMDIHAADVNSGKVS